MRPVCAHSAGRLSGGETVVDDQPVALMAGRDSNLHAANKLFQEQNGVVEGDFAFVAYTPKTLRMRYIGLRRARQC